MRLVAPGTHAERRTTDRRPRWVRDPDRPAGGGSVTPAPMAHRCASPLRAEASRSRYRRRQRAAGQRWLRNRERSRSPGARILPVPSRRPTSGTPPRWYCRMTVTRAHEAQRTLYGYARSRLLEFRAHGNPPSSLVPPRVQPPWHRRGATSCRPALVASAAARRLPLAFAGHAVVRWCYGCSIRCPGLLVRGGSVGGCLCRR